MKDQLDSLVATLADVDADTPSRAAARASLVELGGAAVGLLWPLLSHADAEVRATAAQLLAEIGPPAEPALPKLESMLRDVNANVANTARSAIYLIDANYLPSIDRRKTWRRAMLLSALLVLIVAAAALNLPGHLRAMIGGKDYFEGKHIDQWAEQLDHYEPGISDLSMAQLRAQGKQALPLLTTLATDEARGLPAREHAIELLGELKSKEAAAVLIPLLTHTNQRLRTEAIKAIGRIGKPAEAAIPKLAELLELGVAESGVPLRDVPDLRLNLRAALSNVDGGENVYNVFKAYIELSIFTPRTRWHSLDYSLDNSNLLAHRDEAVEVISLINPYKSKELNIANGVRRAAIHPSGEYAIVIDVIGRISQTRIRNRETIATLKSLPFTGDTVTPFKSWRQIAYSSDANTLAIVRSDELDLYDARSSPYKPLTLDPPPDRKVRSVLFSRDGNTLAVLDDSKHKDAAKLSDGTGWIYDLTTAKLRQQIPGGHVTGEANALSPDGRLLAINSDLVSRNVFIWDTHTGQQIANCGDAEAAGISALAFADNETLIVGHHDGAMMQWHATLGKQTTAMNWHTDTIQAIAVSRDGTKVASADEVGWVKQWQLQPESAK